MLKRNSKDELEIIEDIYELYGDFLSGEKLEITRRFHIPTGDAIVDRLGYLRRMCIGKKVLHIGCLDHPEIIRQKMRNGTWLHGIISSVADVCVGLDINAIGYEFVRSELGVSNVELLDLSKALSDDDIGRLRRIQWEVILCPEILEHVTNHQKVLQNLGRLAKNDTRLLVTGPNAFSLPNFVNTLRQFEELNSDHNYWE